MRQIAVRLLICVFCCGLLAACGNRGPLVLPDPPPPQEAPPGQ